MDGLLPIGVFSERSGLSPKRLRSYAAEGILVPAAIDPASGYRYYSPEQLHVARIIDALREADMPLADVRAVLEHPGRERLDTWASRIDADSTQRRRALDLARSLLAADGVGTMSDERSGEMTMVELKTAGLTETGRVRESNEDAIVHTDRLALVADGMGGLPGGEIAAHATAGVVRAAFTGRSLDELEAAVRAANWTVWDRAGASPDLEGMGTTLCVTGLLEDGRLAVVNVGDSRAYLWRQGELVQLTRDHTVTAELVQRGELLEEKVRQHPHYGVLTRALGVAPEVEIDSGYAEVVLGDRLVVCSDGLFNELSAPEIRSTVSIDEGEAAIAGRLVESAMARGGHDNISVVIAEVVA